jgi:hypothetical protein
MTIKKIVMWSLIAFALFFVAFRPGMAAGVVQTLGNVAADILTGVGKFFGSLSN